MYKIRTPQQTSMKYVTGAAATALIKLSIWLYHITVIFKFLFFPSTPSPAATQPSLSLYIYLSLSYTHTHPCAYNAGAERYGLLESLYIVIYNLRYRWPVWCTIMLRRCSANKKSTRSANGGARVM